jgi:hypothetical protein
MPAESLELWMPSVAARLPFQHRTREERFAPERDEAASIEVTRVQRP